MKRLVFSLLLLTVFFALPSFAENQTVMNVHVDKPVVIPGKVLLPGDYVFKLDNSGAGIRVVSVFSADSKTVYGFIPVYSSYRESDQGSEIHAVRSTGTGLALIDSWYFPGETHGYRFIYSKSDIQKADNFAEQSKIKGM